MISRPDCESNNPKAVSRSSQAKEKVRYNRSTRTLTSNIHRVHDSIISAINNPLVMIIVSSDPRVKPLLGFPSRGGIILLIFVIVDILLSQCL